MASLFSQLQPIEGTARNNRLWLQLNFTKDQANVLKQVIQSPANWSGNLYEGLALDILDTYSIYLPLNGGIPSLNFKHSFERLIPDTNPEFRMISELLGQGMAGVGKDITKYAGQFLSKAGAGITRFGNAIRAFGGTITSPKIWSGATVEDLKVGGTVGFENVDEYNYYRAVQFLLEIMLLPTNTGSDNIAVQVLQGSGFDTKNNILGSLRVNTLAAPNNTIRNMNIVSGTANPISKNGVLSLKSDHYLTAALNDVYLTEAEVTQGTEDGKGIDTFGFSRLMTYSLTLSPMNLSSVWDGMWRLYDAKQTKILNDHLNTKSYTVTKTDLVNSIALDAMNLFLFLDIPGWAFAQARGVLETSSFLLRSKGSIGFGGTGAFRLFFS